MATGQSSSYETDHLSSFLKGRYIYISRSYVSRKQIIFSMFWETSQKKLLVTGGGEGEIKRRG